MIGAVLIALLVGFLVGVRFEQRSRLLDEEIAWRLRSERGAL